MKTKEALSVCLNSKQNKTAKCLFFAAGFRIVPLAAAMLLTGPACPALVINPTFTAGFNTSFGANAAAAQAAWISAANVYTANFSDPVTININVNAVAGTSVFGQSSTFLLGYNWATLYGAVVADAKTTDDFKAIGAGGSITAADPSGGNEWWVSRAEGKALGLIPSDAANDGTTTFGAGNPFTFSGAIAAGTYDFKGVAAHEISEVLGRLGISGGTVGNFPNSHSLIDAFAYTGANTRNLGTGAGVNFSIDNGTTLLKLWNNSNINGLDTRDWAPNAQGQGGDGTPDSFNQYSSPNVVNPVTATDLRLMDVLGYDLVSVPEPTTLALAGLGGLAALVAVRRQRK